MKKYIIFIGMLILIITFSLSLFYTESKQYQDVSQTSSEVPIGELVKSDIIRQSFIVQHNNFNEVQIYFGTYQRLNNSTLKLELFDEEKNVIYEELFNSIELEDNKFRDFVFDPVKNSAGKKFIVSITVEGGEIGNYITLWKSSSDLYKDGELYLNGNQLDGDMVFKTFYTSSMLDKLNDLLRQLPVSIVISYIVLVGGILSCIFYFIVVIYEVYKYRKN
ncbi:hypothetical protein ACFTRD_23960 [Paenibacillus sp. NPDC056933]|uniref:hypothetical protein n=1 Tax=Paenibacillus sp. NPDC056933 TaxID=3345968 RepID=UPI0036354D45